MKWLPHDRFQRVCFLVLLAVFLGTCIDPPYREFLLMQHAPTVLGGVLLVAMSRRFTISRLSFASITLFLCLHSVGARYLYSFTPYDAWSEALLGTSINDLFGFQRNHYDRFVHFSYGLLIAVPIQEFERRYLNLSIGVASILAVESILATSAAYELAEWLVAVVFVPAWAEQFLGHQGDPFDAQKDMALATAGAILSVSVAALCSRMRRTSSLNIQ
jgi:putative membrane protein